MKCLPPVFNMCAVGAAERSYRRRLEQEPLDTSARLRLAWCLVVRAFHESGQEAMMARLAPAAGNLNEPPARPMPSAVDLPEFPEESAYRLLRSCLKQAMMVRELSTDAEEQREAEKLRSLIDITGGLQAIHESDAESERILAEVTQAILYGSEAGMTLPDPYSGPNSCE